MYYDKQSTSWLRISVLIVQSTEKKKKIQTSVVFYLEKSKELILMICGSGVNVVEEKLTILLH